MKMLQWKYTPVLIGVVVLLYLVWDGHQRVVTVNQGHFVYAVDDAYIHMAMAKNLVNHGVLGVTPKGFTSSSSSIIWPLLLGLGYLLWGVNDWMPLALNIFFAVASLAVIGFYLRLAGARGWLILALLLAAIFLVPAAPLIFCGMEHHLHAFAAICLMGSLWRVVSSTSAHPSSSKLMLMTAALVTASRYEGLIMVGVVCVYLYLEQRRSLALRVGIAGAVALGRAVGVGGDLNNRVGRLHEIGLGGLVIAGLEGSEAAVFETFEGVVGDWHFLSFEP